MPTYSQLIVWIAVGLVGGSLAAKLITGEREGYGLWINLCLGLLGALVGGLLFRLFDLLPGLDQFAVSLRDVISAIVGSVIVLVCLWGIRSARRGQAL